MADEVEVTVKQVERSATSESQSLSEGMRRLFLAGVGAVALTRDKAEALMDRLVVRGELAQQESERMLDRVEARLRQGRAQVEQAGARVEQDAERLLRRFNIPTRRDIEELNQRIAQLTARVEELRKRQP